MTNFSFIDAFFVADSDNPVDLDTPSTATSTLYDLVANVTHESVAGTTRDKENTVWKVHLRAPGGENSEKWFQVQDLIVEEVRKEMIFLGETVLQVNSFVSLRVSPFGTESLCRFGNDGSTCLVDYIVYEHVHTLCAFRKLGPGNLAKGLLFSRHCYLLLSKGNAEEETGSVTFDSDPDVIPGEPAGRACNLSWVCLAAYANRVDNQQSFESLCCYYRRSCTDLELLCSAMSRNSGSNMYTPVTMPAWNVRED